MAFSMKKRGPSSLKMIAPHTTTDGEYLTFFLMQDSSTLSSTSSDKPTYYRKVDSSENTIWKIIIKHCILTNRVNKSQSSLQNLHAIIMDKLIGFLQMCPIFRCPRRGFPLSSTNRPLWTDKFSFIFRSSGLLHKVKLPANGKFLLLIQCSH